MPEPVKDRLAMIAGMAPELQPGRFVFCALNDLPLSAAISDGAICLFREAEGVSVLVPVDLAEAEGLPVELPMCQIARQVFSSLAGVGLTAAVSAALGTADIPCNMIAAARHDHVIVPEDRAMEALAVLKSLSASAR